jgi:NADP-dependent 3-hydroxy acid dehydrogenase YdfG
VITGASSGFGRGAAVELARRSAHVVAAACNGDALGEVLEACKLLQGSAVAVITDVSNPREVDRLAREAVTRFSKFDAWVNDAG